MKPEEPELPLCPVTRFDGRLPAQRPTPIIGSARHRPIRKVVDAEIEFLKDEKGVVTDLVLHQNGRDQKAPRRSATAEQTLERKAIAVAAAALKQYVGVYELAPGIDIAMTLEANQLMTQVTGQPTFPLFAETETRFFLKVVDAQVDFVKDSSGAVTHIILHQGGRDQKAARK